MLIEQKGDIKIYLFLIWSSFHLANQYILLPTLGSGFCCCFSSYFLSFLLNYSYFVPFVRGNPNKPDYIYSRLVWINKNIQDPSSNITHNIPSYHFATKWIS